MLRNESTRVSLKGRQVRWHCNHYSGLPSIHPTFSLEHIGCMPSKGLDATEVPSCFQILWPGLWPCHLSHTSLWVGTGQSIDPVWPWGDKPLAQPVKANRVSGKSWLYLLSWASESEVMFFTEKFHQRFFFSHLYPVPQPQCHRN